MVYCMWKLYTKCCPGFFTLFSSISKGFFLPRDSNVFCPLPPRVVQPHTKILMSCYQLRVNFLSQFHDVLFNTFSIYQTSWYTVEPENYCCMKWMNGYHEESLDAYKFFHDQIDTGFWFRYVIDFALWTQG